MDGETKELLRESIEISKENNAMLKKMVRAQKWTNIYRVVYWGIIIFSSLGAYYFIQPYLSSLINLYSGGVSDIGKISDISQNLNIKTDKQQFQDLLDSFKK
jgi:hypothetical protein